MMTRVKALLHRLAVAWEQRAVALKAVSFAMVGVVNTTIDYGVFFLARALIGSSASATGVLAGLVAACRCGTIDVATLIAANLIAWLVAVSGSYVMNSFITFAAESGRQLRAKAYLSFIASGIAGVITNTTTLVIAAHFMPVWAAKAIAILASFAVNFLLSHFVVFRPAKTDETRLEKI